MTAGFETALIERRYRKCRDRPVSRRMTQLPGEHPRAGKRGVFPRLEAANSKQLMEWEDSMKNYHPPPKVMAGQLL